MNAFQNCRNTSDLVPLYIPLRLYLKPIARLNISLQLPNLKKLGKSISHWEIMGKLRDLVKPDEFTVLKVIKTTIEFVRFEGEIETRAKLKSIISKIDNKTIKLKDFSDLLRVRAAEWKSDFPNHYVWDDFFQNAKDMDELKPGERPDTIHLSNLPTKWFLSNRSLEEDCVPSEKMFYRIFEKFGPIRYVDIPVCDPYRKKMKDHISGIKNSSFEKTDFFEGYVQFKDYIGFTRTMDAFRNMTLVHKDDSGAVEVNINVDFDKSKHLSDASIKRREIVRDRLIKKAKEKEEREKAEMEEKKHKEEMERQQEINLKQQKELRRKLREEKRKVKILETLEVGGTDEINEKIAKEEKKLLKVQRKLEAIRLVEELFGRLKDKGTNNKRDGTNSKIQNDELKKLKRTSELEVLAQREKLHNTVKGRALLKNILGKSTRKKHSSGSDSSLSLEEPDTRQPETPGNQRHPDLIYDPAWFGYQYRFPAGPILPDYADFPSVRGVFSSGRIPFPKLPGLAGPSRGAFNRRGNPRWFRGSRRGYRRYPPDIEEEYQKYFSKFLNEHIDSMPRNKRLPSPTRHSSRRTRSRSRTTRRSYSRSYSRSRSRRRSRDRRSRSYSSRSRSYSPRSRSRSRSRSKSRRSRSRTGSKASSVNKSHSGLVRKTVRTPPKSGGGKSPSREKSPSKRSREKSVDSSKTPKQLSHQRSERSRSWSLPKEGEKERSWSKSPEK